MIKYIKLTFVFVFVCLMFMCTNAYASQVDISLRPEFDVTLSPEQTGGTGGSLYVSNNNTDDISSVSYKAYLFYDLSGVDKTTIEKADFEAIFIQGALGTDQILKVYAVPEDKDDIDYTLLNWNNAPCNVTDSSRYVTSDAIFIGDIAVTEKNVPLTAVGGNLKSVIKNDTDNKLILVVVRESLRNSRYSMASTKNKDYSPPTIKVRASVMLDGYYDAIYAINKLPESTTEQKLKKASLMWAADDALSAFRQGLTEQAKTQINDVKNTINKDIAKHSGKYLFPDMLVTQNNPYLSSLENTALKNMQKVTVYKKNWDWGIENFPQSKNLRSEFSVRLEAGSFLLTQRYGKYSESPELLMDMFDCLEALCYYHTAGDLDAGRTSNDPNMNRFVYSSYNVALLNIMTSYPDLIIPSVKQRWLKCVSDVASYQMSSFGTTTNKKNPHGAGYYANMDACYTAVIGIAGEILNNDTYRTSAINRSVIMENYMCLDGGWPYLGYANETPTYHQVIIQYLTYYYMVTGNEQTFDMLCKSEPYYPMTIIKNALTEYSTVPYFKQYWDFIDTGYIEVIANFANSGRNRYLAQNIIDLKASSGSVFGTLFYNPQIEKVATDTNIAFYDRNIMGPKGYFDNFAYYANGRDWKDDRGKPTLIGAVAVGDGAYPSKGFFQNAYGGVYDTNAHSYHLIQETVAPKAFDMEERHSETNGYAQWQKAKVSAFGSVYRLQKPQGGGGRSSVTPYGGSQLWIMLPDRVIGVVNTNLGDLTTAFGMEGVLQFGEGRGNTAVNTEIQKVSDNTFYYDGLQAIIHEHNYKTVTTEKPKYIETSIYGPVQYIKFNDTDLTSEKTYSKGYNSYYVAEIGVKGSTPAKVDLSQNDGIRRITVDEKGNIWYAFHNTSEKAKDIVAFEDMYCIIEQTTKFVKKGETINIEGYGVLLAKKATDLTGFYYGDSKATALVPNAQITLKNEFDVDGTLIIAVYDNGELSHISFANENQLAYKLPSDISGITVKGFLIDKGNVRPLESAITVKDDK